MTRSFRLAARLVSLLVTACAAPTVGELPTPADFESRCNEPGVIRCFGFEQAELRDAGGSLAWSVYDAPVGVFVGGLENGTDLSGRVELATEYKASGASSLKFYMPSRSGGSYAGQFYANFADDFSTQFGEGDEFFIQWRQRFSPEFLTNRYFPYGNWKQIIVGEGDRPLEKSWSCTQIELVVNRGDFGEPAMYHSCGGKDGSYEPIPAGWSVRYQANQWMTFQLHVRIGTWYQNDRRYKRDSLIELWVGREGETSRRVIRHRYDLANENPDARYGKVWLLPFLTDKDPSQEHANAYTWYDELIISRTPIADPLE